MNFFKAIGGLLFGGSSDKGIVEQAADAVERFAPGTVKQHEMSIEDLKAGDESQKNAQQLILPTHETIFDVAVDGITRLIRPAISFWAIGVLFGFISTDHLQNIDPMAWNLIITVIGFYMGFRAITKDFPSLIQTIRKK